MDKEIVEKVTRIVIETLEEMKEDKTLLTQNAVKIWYHQSPLPDPIIVKTSSESKEPKNKDKMITISPYV